MFSCLYFPSERQAAGVYCVWVRVGVLFPMCCRCVRERMFGCARVRVCVCDEVNDNAIL